ncbi:MAG: protein BatD, partial [candidate division Zixibacteria bacterium]|nr:protein BatD [candidate division Zixibacteria bacterium]
MASCARFLLWLSMVLCLFAVFPSRAQELSVEASVDASRISVDDVVTLVISVSGRNLEDAPEPSLPALNDFLIVGRSSATSSNFSLSNGQVNTSQTIQYIYQLQPRQTGKFVIGTASVAYGGRTYRTTPFTIEVTQGQTGGQRPSSGTSPGQNAPPGKTTYAKDDMFLRAIIDKKQAFAGEQITVVYKLFTRVELTTAQYDRLPSYTGFWVEEFFSAKHLEYKQEIVDGKRYATAILKQIALFPTVTGEQQIEPLTMLCDVPAGGKNLIDSFFNDPFFSRTHQVSIQTEPQTVEVVPLPASGQPRGFGGAVGQFSIRSFVDQTKAEVNQPVTMTVEVSGTGNIKTLGEPVLPDLAVFKRYASESRDEIAPNNQQIAGKKIFTHVLIPLHPGEQRIAPASFVFFDPVSRAYKTVTTTPLVLSVEPGRDGGGVAGVMPQKTAVSQMRQDIQYIKPETVSLEDQGTALYGSLWYILLHLIPAAAAEIG